MSSASVRSARENARRRSARSRQAWSACSQAPRPGRARRVSTTAWGCPVPSVTATTRSRTDRRPRSRHPTHMRTGPPGSASRVRSGSRTRGPAPVSLPPRLTNRDLRAPQAPCHPRRSGCRCANRSASPPAVRSVPPCRWRGTAGSPARRRGRPAPPRPPRSPR